MTDYFLKRLLSFLVLYGLLVGVAVGFQRVTPLLGIPVPLFTLRGRVGVAVREDG